MSEPFPLIPRRELDFLLYEWLRVDGLLKKPEYAEHSRETVDAVLDLSERLACEMFLPHHRKSDIEEPRLDGDDRVRILPEIGAALRQYAALGMFSAGFPAPLGGMGLPYSVCCASFAQFSAANIATSAYVMLTVANAALIAAFGTVAQIERFAKPQIEGRWFGTMCLSEPQAGSSLADIRTRAEPDGEDALGSRHRLTGNKMWISGGDQDVSENIVHLVLAKVPGKDGALPDGTAGISLFVVPKVLPDGSRNDIAVAGLNHKMGYRGTANCLLNFGERTGAIGWRIGPAGHGLPQMFRMMNEARIGVGLGAAAVGYRGYRHALRYARERRQGRPYDVRSGPPIAIVEHADVKRMLLQQKTYVEGALALCLYCALLVDEHDDPRAVGLLGLLTPVAKTWSSEYGLAANDLAIQVLGGYGYTRDFAVEQLWRDNRLNPIHEGTTGIQAVDLLGRKILRSDGTALSAAMARMNATRALAAGNAELSAHAAALGEIWARIDRTIEVLRGAPGARAYDNATFFLWAFGHAVVAWLWLDQVVAAARAQDRSLYAGKLRACRFFFEIELPRAHTWLEVVASLTGVAAEMSNDDL
jgi:alkylation response protein AidB-like acyl-CoA dehydrogenase